MRSDSTSNAGSIMQTIGEHKTGIELHPRHGSFKKDCPRRSALPPTLSQIGQKGDEKKIWRSLLDKLRRRGGGSD